MRLALPLILAVLTAPALATAQETAAASAPAGVDISTSFSYNVPLLGLDAAAKRAEEDRYRQDLTERSAKECAMLLATVAASCAITSMNVSVQVNANPGQPDYLYASATVTMRAEMK